MLGEKGRELLWLSVLTRLIDTCSCRLIMCCNAQMRETAIAMELYRKWILFLPCQSGTDRAAVPVSILY